MIFSFVQKNRKKTAIAFSILMLVDWVAPVYLYATQDRGLFVSSYALFNSSLQDSQYSPLYPGGLLNKPIYAAPHKGNIEKRDPFLNIAKSPEMGGPGQPEMSSFQSVNASNMVDLFTGDFSYNIPLLDVGGYPVNLHYSAGSTMDQEASWVGLGWNINPGTISRNMRGLPDDFDGKNDLIKKEMNIRPNRTVGVTVEGSLQVYGKPLQLSAQLGVFHNTYNGLGLETGVGIGATSKAAFGELTGGLSISNNTQSGVSVSPSLTVKFNDADKSSKLQSSMGISTGYNSRGGLSELRLYGGVKANIAKKGQKEQMSNFSFPSSSISFATPSYTPSIRMPMHNTSRTFIGRLGGEVWTVDGGVSFTGYINEQKIPDAEKIKTMPAAGYLYFSNVRGREDILTDFNREKDLEFNYKSSPSIALPQYTYDAYSISGEGTGGSFRPYRGDAGYVYDHSAKSGSESVTGSFDIGFGAVAHAGMEINYVTVSNTTGKWAAQNKIESRLRFQQIDTTYEPVYFRNPGEKTTNAAAYYNALANDSLIRIKLGGSGKNVYADNAFAVYGKDGKQAKELPVTQNIVKNKRDKRSQVISYFTAEEAQWLGLDKSIKSYHLNSIPVGNCSGEYSSINRVDPNIRKKNHLSEITILNADGRRYIYGLPAYNIEQQDVTFAVNKETVTGNLEKGLVNYAEGDNSSNNQKGQDWYFSKETVPAYAHNFLLTGLLSPDYYDLTGNGISEDDPGDAVKFNYTRVYGDNNNYYEWRTPFEQNKANYNEGFKSFSQDDKGTYIYGKKEMWFLNSIESKTMIAAFHIEDGRTDAMAALGENGGGNTTKSAKKLTRIDLYVKADIIKNGIAKSKPVKSVHFEYDYLLCKGINNDPVQGKLTLKKVYFTYNKNTKGQRNPYIFHYALNSTGQVDPLLNPAYNPVHTDRWGVYKDPVENPGDMSNADYPYSNQDSAKAASFATAWNLTNITLPSGGRLKITYESDDYAYIQNKRATSMFAIAGIESPDQNKLYHPSTKEQYYKLYINSPVPILNKKDLKNKFLAIDNNLYFKIAVQMPSDFDGSGHEMVPGYAKIQDYDVVPGNNQQFWIKLEPTESKSPLVRSAIQFLRLNLPSKAYPASRMPKNADLKDVIKRFAASFGEFKNMIEGFENATISRNVCINADLEKSFVRLSCPEYKKYGGGYRVKKVEIFDNWNAMTSQKESVYGQHYYYTSSEEVDGKNVLISSGVASYEPVIGGEENPFRTPVNYSEKQAPMAPVNYMFTEEPFGESFFPAPVVGYSKVRVRTINMKTRSANGWEETEFFTTRDFPVFAAHSLLEKDISKKKFENKINLLKFERKNFVTISQGFKIELNDMNGKVKRQASYAESDSLNPISYSMNFYKVENDKSYPQRLNNKVWVVDSVNGKINTEGQIGLDIEVMTDLREHESKSFTAGLAPNTDIVAPFFPTGTFPFVSMWRLPKSENVRFRSAAVTKIVQRYGILDSVVVMDKGSVVSTKNILYDGESGEVVMSRTNNEFNDPIYQLNYPAYWAYSGMGPAYFNTGAQIEIKNGTAGFQLNGGRLFRDGNSETYPTKNLFESGDEIFVYEARLAERTEDDCRYLQLSDGTWTGKLWAMEAAKGQENDQGIYFIDSLGKVAPNMAIKKLKIVRSGKRNLLSASVGAVTMMENPILQQSGGGYALVIGNASRVINASANVYKDLWKVENTYYQQDSLYRVLRDSTITLYPISSLLMRGGTYRYGSSRPLTIFDPDHTLNSPNFTAGLRKDVHTGQNLKKRYEVYNNKSIIQFDLSSIQKAAIINSALLQIYSRSPKEVWDGTKDEKSENWSDLVFGAYQNGELDGQTNASKLLLVNKRWDQSIEYDAPIEDNSEVVNIAAVPNESCIDETKEVKTLVQKMVNAPGKYTGIMLKLQNEGFETSSNSLTRIRSFGAICSKPSWAKCTLPSGQQIGCCVCSDPKLTVHYSYWKDTVVKLCKLNISDTATNPYRWGILGNWRMEKAFVYYNERMDSDASSSQSNIRREGSLKNFAPYWAFSANALQPSTDESKWVWNSAISEFNKRGFETENFDPLGRYNSGLYGYSQSVPIAMAQNSRYKNILFDGFEDYGYKTKVCNECPPQREFSFKSAGSEIVPDPALSHTGLYSAKVNAGSEILLTANVSDTLNNDGPRLSALLDSIPKYTIEVVGSGTGLKGEYKMGKKTAFTCLPLQPVQTRTDASIDFDWTNSLPFPPGTGGCTESFQVTWTGTIQPRYTDKYYFKFLFKGKGVVVVNNKKIIDYTHNEVKERRSFPIGLEQGKLYQITVTYLIFEGKSGPVKLMWGADGNQPEEVVGQPFLYPLPPSQADTANSIEYNIEYYCVNGKTVKPFNVIKPVFAPLKKTPLTISAWARFNPQDCINGIYPDEVVKAEFDTGGEPASAWLKKTGNIIEGWQRYEANVNVPAAASKIFLRLKSKEGSLVYIDDVRVQPFNSGMKSFVYSPVNLRLMAELDENNYAAFYEYDDEGTLIRVKKETERGIMTIKETRSTLLKQ